jgi:hypothetical protein
MFGCHSERREESRKQGWILHFAQDDLLRFIIISMKATCYYVTKQELCNKNN